VGGGLVSSAHGMLPVPGPAVLEILRFHEIPWRGGPVEQELLTPTGASLLAAMVNKFLLEYPMLRVQCIGYGAGSRKLAIPNALRGLVGQLETNLVTDRIVQLETNVDDVTGEVLAHLMELLMKTGALDVSVIPIIMKKGRSGNIIRVIVKQDEMSKASRLIMRETGSLGIRVFPNLHRFIAERESKNLEVEIGGSMFNASVKISRLDGEILAIKPEFDDCQNIAAKISLPLREVMKKVDEAARKEIGLK
jgi:pyridinium-3,5-bisthiocarboxylic acid mononucleotide nickel chelatase